MRKDFADAFAAEGEGTCEVLDKLKARSLDALDLALEDVPEGSVRERYGYVKERVLPLLTKLEDSGEREAALEDTAQKTGLKLAHLRKALSEAEEQARSSSVPDESENESLGTAPAAGTERHERAMDILTCPNILEEAAKDMEAIGHVGERNTKKLALICALSAKSGKPIQPSTHAQSSAGKNALWDATLSLLPEEMVVRRSGLTAKALFRTEANLKGAVLYLQEVAGSEDANYSIRVMQSDGRLEYEATEKMPDGGMKNVVYQTEGPTVIVQTTTKNHLHPENETRVFPIYIDESEEQTGRIVKSVLKDATGQGVNDTDRERVRHKWQDAIGLLEPGKVVIPYAERIEIPNSPIRIRRDARRLVDVVRVIAWLHQHGRERDEVGRIVATEEDFHTALALVSESLTRAWRTLTPAEETVLKAITELPEQLRTRGFRRRDLKVPNISDRRIKEVLKSLTDTGYLDCDGRQGPQGYSYTVAREAEEVSLGISLRPSPDKEENAANDDNSTGREAFARYRPIPDTEREENLSGQLGATGRNGNRPVESNDLQEKFSIGRSGDYKEEEEKSRECSVINIPDNQKSKERSQAVAEGLHRLLEEHPEYLKRRPGQIACRLHMGRYTLFVPTDEEVEAVIEEVP